MLQTDDLTRYCDDHRQEALEELEDWLRIPSISADGAHRADVRRAAEHAATRMRALGMQRAEVLESKGHPVIYGEWLGAPGKPTVLVYGHYDVQPVDPLELWASPPFEPQVRDGHLFARGAVDDKGQVVMHWEAFAAHLRTRKTLPLNLKYIIEGEEEIGSPNFDDFVAHHRDLLACDVVVVSDTPIFSEDVPSLTIAVRGLVNWEIHVDGPTLGDQHSGLFGGAIDNPINALTHIVAKLKDEHGRITVPGFYDDVRELGPQERAEIAALPFDEAAEAKRLGVPQLHGERGFNPLERMWWRPTLDCNGIWGGYQGEGSKTIIPAKAGCKITARLVPDQDPARITKLVADYIRAITPPGVRVHVESHEAGRAIVTSREHPATKAAARAMERAFGKPPVMIGMGGSIGPVATFDRTLRLPQVLIGVGLPDDQTHAPNEKFTLSQFYGGIKTMAYLWDELAATL
ncbi:dipeptidase [bacterium]|nr:MAG: dipeptidase [bacterium]